MDHAAPKKIDFSDLEDGEFGGSAAPIARKTDAEMMDAAAPRVAPNLARSTPAQDAEVSGEMYREPCRKCGGSGRYNAPSIHGSRCFACKGQGYKLFRSSPEQRAAAKARKIQRAAEDAKANSDAFRAANPAIAAWLDAASARGFGFAVSLAQDLGKYGRLTDGQRAAVERCMAKDAERAKARDEQAAAPKPVVDTAGLRPLIEALKTARASGLKWARLTVAGEPPITFSLAKDSSPNAGCVYAKADGLYLGKITPDGRLLTSYDGRTREAEIVEACKDPLAKAKLYGLQTGRCGCCGRELTDPESIAAGIGPICAGRFGW